MQALGQWGRSPENAGRRRVAGPLVFSLPDSARHPPAFYIVPTDRKPETGLGQA